MNRSKRSVEKRPEEQKKKKFIHKGLQSQLLAWSVLIGTILLICGTTFAWYTTIKKEADSEILDVMTPYYLTLLNPSESDALSLSVGRLMPGKVKQIVFCVSNRNDEENGINSDKADFDYTLELIHTDNLDLIYSLYALEAATADTADIVAEDVLVVDGVPTTQPTYWTVQTPGSPLAGNDVSAERHEQVSLSGNEINSGTYIAYEGEDLHLSVTENGYDSQYFLLEIEWTESAQTNFERYERETDMIYVLAKAVQPVPQKKTTQ